MPWILHGFSYIGKCRVQWDHILPQLKIIIFFFLEWGSENFGDAGARGGARPSCWARGCWGPRRGDAGKRGERSCAASRGAGSWQGVSCHIEATQHLEGHPQAAARRAAPASGRLWVWVSGRPLWDQPSGGWASEARCTSPSPAHLRLRMWSLRKHRQGAAVQWETLPSPLLPPTNTHLPRQPHPPPHCVHKRNLGVKKKKKIILLTPSEERKMCIFCSSV